MAIIYEDASTEYEQTLENINLGFTIVFLLEAIIKIIGLGTKAYFHVKWNQFDFFVVATSILDILLNIFVGSNVKFLRIGP
jgi:hypothetical protein